MSTKSLLYVLAQTQNETMTKMKKILDGLEGGSNNNGSIVKIPNSAKLLLKHGETLISNPLLLLLYSNYFLSSSDCLQVEQNNLTNSMPCEMVSTEDMILILELISKGQVLVEVQRQKGFQLAVKYLGISCNPISTFRYGLRKFPSFVSDEYFQSDIESLVFSLNNNDGKGLESEHKAITEMNNEESKTLPLEDKNDLKSIDQLDTAKDDAKGKEQNLEFKYNIQSDGNVSALDEIPPYNSMKTLNKSVRNGELLNLDEEILNVSFLQGYQTLTEKSGFKSCFPPFCASEHSPPQSPETVKCILSANTCITIEKTNDVKYLNGNLRSKSNKHKKGYYNSPRMQRIMGISGKVWECTRCPYWHYNQRRVYKHQKEQHKNVRDSC